MGEIMVNEPDLLKETLERINGWIENADTKISILLGVEIIAFGWVLDRSDEIRRFFSTLEYGKDDYLIILIGWFVLAVAASLWNGYRGLRPKLDLPPKMPPSPFFYGTIAEFELEAYRGKLMELDEKQAFDEMVNQIWVNSKIARAKFEAARASIDAFFLAILPLAIVFIWMMITNGTR
jgi:hypothetical protein